MRERNKIQLCVVIHNAWPNHKITVRRENHAMYQIQLLGNARIHRASRPPALRTKNNPGGYRQGPLEYSGSVTRTRQNNFQILQEEEQP